MFKKFLSTTIFILSSILVLSQATPSWSFLGPVQFPTNISGQMNGMGRVVQLKFHPTKGNILYAVAAHSLWKSTDTANTWQVISGADALPSLNTASICIDYTNDNTLYLGSGDANYYSNSFGIFKSTDGGASFNLDTVGIGKRLVIETLMSPFDHNTLIAATNDGIWKSTNGGASWIENIIGGQFTDMRFKANTAGTNTIYAVTKTGGFYLSGDLGDTWSQITSVLPSAAGGNAKLAVSIADSNVVYAGFVGSNSTTGGIIFKSTDGGNTFTLKKGDTAPNLIGYTSSTAGQSSYNFDMEASPSNANSLYVVAHLVWKSDDSGASWIQTIANWAQFIHTDMHCMRFDPYDTTKLFNCNDGGVWLSLDRGYTWKPLSNGLDATEFYHFANSRFTKYIIQAGAQDNGAIYFNTNTWYTNAGGDVTTPFFFDNNAPAVAYNVSAGTRKTVTTNGSSVLYKLPFTASSSDKYAFSYFNNGIAYVAHVDSVYKTSNINSATAGSIVWGKIGSFTTAVMAVGTSPTDANQLYVVTLGGTGVGKIYRSDNATAASPTFTQVSVTPYSASFNAFIYPAKSNSNVVYMSNGSKMFKSVNKGVNWVDITGTGLPTTNITNMLIDTANPKDGMYVLDNLLYYKDSTMTSWTNISGGLPTSSAIRDMDIFYDGTGTSTLRTAFYGRGIWETPAYSPTAILPVTMLNFNATLLNGQTQLAWSTSQEHQNAYFDVQKSYDAIDFSMLTAVAGSGNSSTQKNYFAVDPSPYNGRTYYRLKQVDADGKATFSSIVSVASQANLAPIIFPNPASTIATIQLNATENSNMLITITNLNGQIVMWRRHNVVVGANNINVDVSRLANGMYFVNLNNSNVVLKLQVNK